MDIRGLKYFICAAECLNFTRAAKECYITQTAMSLHIAKMEEELGFQLFNRNNRTVELTMAGKEFYERAKLVLQSYEDAVYHSKNTAEGKTGRVTLMVPSCIEGLVIMPRLKRFREVFPNISLEVRLNSPRYLIESLKRYEVDAILCWSEDMEQDPDLELTDVGSFPICMAAGINHPIARVPKVPVSMMANQKSVMIELNGMPNSYRNVGNSWAKVGFDPISVTRVDNMEEVLFYVEMEDGVALVPEYVSYHATGMMVFRPLDIPGKDITMGLGVARLKTNQNPALDSLISVLGDQSIFL